MNGLKKFNKSQKNFCIDPLQYQLEVPFLVHSTYELNDIENELSDSISNQVADYYVDKMHNEIIIHMDIKNISTTIIALYSYISFEALKKFLENWPIEIPDEDFLEIKKEILEFRTASST